MRIFLAIFTFFSLLSFAHAADLCTANLTEKDVQIELPAEAKKLLIPLREHIEKQFVEHFERSALELTKDGLLYDLSRRNFFVQSGASTHLFVQVHEILAREIGAPAMLHYEIVQHNGVWDLIQFPDIVFNTVLDVAISSPVFDSASQQVIFQVNWSEKSQAKLYSVGLNVDPKLIETVQQTKSDFPFAQVSHSSGVQAQDLLVVGQDGRWLVRSDINPDQTLQGGAEAAIVEIHGPHVANGVKKSKLISATVAMDGALAVSAFGLGEIQNLIEINGPARTPVTDYRVEERESALAYVLQFNNRDTGIVFDAFKNVPRYWDEFSSLKSSPDGRYVTWVGIPLGVRKKRTYAGGQLIEHTKEPLNIYILDVFSQDLKTVSLDLTEGLAEGEQRALVDDPNFYRISRDSLDLTTMASASNRILAFKRSSTAAIDLASGAQYAVFPPAIDLGYIQSGWVRHSVMAHPDYRFAPNGEAVIRNQFILGQRAKYINMSGEEVVLGNDGLFLGLDPGHSVIIPKNFSIQKLGGK